MESIDLNKRIDSLDYLRGFALLGIILINSVYLLDARLPEEHSIDALYQRFLYLFIEGRFYTIFSFLFGVGFYIFISRAYAKGNNGVILFLRRIAWMFAFGLIHSIFHPGEALTVYAFCGLIVLPFNKIKREINLVIGIILLIGFSILAVKVLLPLPMILLGFTAGQYHVFENITKKMKSLFFFTTIMLIMSIIGISYQFQHVPSTPFDGFHLNEVDSGKRIIVSTFLNIGIMVGPVLSAFYVGLLILLLRKPSAQNLLSPLKYYGRMSLTNYIMQTVLLVLVGNIFSLKGNVDFIETLYLCILIYFIQLLFSTVWLRYFHFGPLEWFWRWLTYLKMPELKKQSNT